MVTIIKVTQYALFSDDRNLDILIQEFLAENPELFNVPLPDTNDQRTLSVAAGLLELLALRHHQQPPSWTSTIGGLPEPFFIRKSAAKNERLKKLCLEEAPEPLRKRNIYSTANFLMSHKYPKRK